jgi:cytochrome oxidase assembly protein ShyY1
MSALKLDDPVRRLMGLIGVVVALFIAAVVLAVTQYQVSRESDQTALRHSQTQVLTREASSTPTVATRIPPTSPSSRV